jgi:hypothetical protein
VLYNVDTTYKPPEESNLENERQGMGMDGVVLSFKKAQGQLHLYVLHM